MAPLITVPTTARRLQITAKTSPLHHSTTTAPIVTTPWSDPMSAMPVPTVPARPEPRRASRSVIISAWAVPAMVLGQFAMMAIFPVTVLVRGTLRDPDLRPLRWWAAAVAAAYATPLVLWAVGPDRARSLSKDMDPVYARAIVATAAAFIVAFHVVTRRTRSDG
jgi:hypothetical protein